MSDPTITERLRKLPTEIKLLVEKRAELLFLNLSDRLTDAINKAVYKIIGLFLILLGVIFLLHTLALFIGELLDNEVLGYLIISVTVILIGLLLYFLKPGGLVKGTKAKMQKPLDETIRESFHSSSDTEKNETNQQKN